MAYMAVEVHIYNTTRQSQATIGTSHGDLESGFLPRLLPTQTRSLLPRHSDHRHDTSLDSRRQTVPRNDYCGEIIRDV